MLCNETFITTKITKTNNSIIYSFLFLQSDNVRNLFIFFYKSLKKRLTAVAFIISHEPLSVSKNINVKYDFYFTLKLHADLLKMIKTKNGF